MNTKEGTSRQATEAQREVFELPPELKAQQAMMDQIFGVLKDAHVTEPHNSHGNLPSERSFDIEEAIMRAPDFDYLLASEIFAALHRRLELRYENNLNTELEARLKKLSESFDHVCG